MLSLVLAALAAAPLQESLRPPFPQYPSLSPDGSVCVFSSAGDLWAVPTTGGAAWRLTVHPALELSSAFSPDGKLLAFESNRTGTTNLFVSDVVRRDGRVILGEPRRVTDGDRSKQLSGFSADGSHLLFTSTHEPDAYRGANVYRVPVEGGPIEPLFDAYGMDAHALPDGSGYVFTRGRGTSERPQYRGSGTSSIWRYDARTDEFWPMVPSVGSDGSAFATPDGALVFLSTRGGQNDLWMTSREGDLQLVYAPRAEGDALTLAHGLRDLTVSADGRTAAACLWDDVVLVDLPSRRVRTLAIDAYGALERDPVFRVDVARDVSEAALSPDGKSMAVVARGEVFVRPVAEGRPTHRITATDARESGLQWAPDGSALYFVSDTEDGATLWRATVVTTREDILPKEEETEPEDEAAPTEESGDEASEPAGEVEDEAAAEDGGDPVADDDAADDDDDDGDEKDEKEEKIDHGARWEGVLETAVEAVHSCSTAFTAPRISPDGKRVAVQQERGDLVLVDLADGTARTLFRHWDTSDVIWAADSRHLVVAKNDLDFNLDLYWLDADAESPELVNITRHPDLDHEPALSADGKVLAWLSDRAGENFSYDVHVLVLDRELDAMQPWELAEHFEAAAKDVKWPGPDDEVEPFEPDLTESWLRARRITSLPGSEQSTRISASGDRIYFTGSVGEDSGLWSVDHDGKDRKSIVSGSLSDLRLSADGKRFTFVQGGQAKHVAASGGKVETVGIDASFDVVVADEQAQKFRDAARAIGIGFYHPTLKGLDWDGIAARYATIARTTRTSQAFNRLFNLMLGELDGSHMGMFGGRDFDGPGERTGYLGAEFAPAVGGYEVTYVVPDSPAALGTRALRVGDRVTAVAGEPTAEEGALPTRDWRAFMASRAGEETLFDVLRAEGTAERLVLRPVSYGTWTNLRYDDEIRRRRARVEELSEGRLGYLHIRGMSMPSVLDFERDLYAAAHGKDGLVIDVRDNGGGSTCDILLASLTAPNHAYTIPRGADPAEVPHDAYPRDRRLIYGYSRPIVVLINENSFSNAEIFAHAIKTIARGKLVGEPTFGGVISTGSYSLIDGSRVRMPFRGWYLPDGTDMESHGAQPDVLVPRLPGDEEAGIDRQLDRAVETLLEDV
ncbi:MAG: S41 family peptidase [Planctomycetota bacterium]